MTTVCKCFENVSVFYYEDTQYMRIENDNGEQIAAFYIMEED